MQDSSFSDLDDLYQEVILDHYRSPRNLGSLPTSNASSRGFNPFCGDEVVLHLSLTGSGKVEAIAFTGQGCSISQASASILTELVKDKSLDEVENIGCIFRRMMRGDEPSDREIEKLEDLEALRGVRRFPVRIKCALLAWSTLDDALEEHLTKQSNP